MRIVFALFLLLAILPSRALHADPVELKLRLRVGDVHRHELTMEHEIQWQMPEGPRKQSVVTDYHLQWQVREFDEYDDSWLVRLQFPRVRMHSYFDDGTKILDEDSHEGAKGSQISSVLVLALAGSHVDLWLYQDGYHFISDLDVLRFDATRRLLDLGHYATTREALDMTDSWIDNHLLTVLANCMPEYSEEPVEVGETWEVEDEWEEGLDMWALHKLTKREEGMAHIHTETRMKSVTGGGITMNIGAQTVSTGDTTSTAETIVRESDGWVVHRVGTIQMDGMALSGLELPEGMKPERGGVRTIALRTPE